MKTRNIFSMLFAAVLSAVAFTSCNLRDDPFYDSNRIGDKCESSTLSGQWHGNFGMRYTYKWHGSYTTFDSYSTDIVFYPDYNGSTCGWGRQVDWYNAGPYLNLQHKFNWNIRNGIIYLSYPYDHRLDCSIRDYHMNNSCFTGYFSTGTQRFSLNKMNNSYNWGIYTSDYSSKANSTFGVTFTRSANSDASNEGEQIESDEEQGVIVKYSNRYAAEDSDF